MRVPIISKVQPTKHSKKKGQDEVPQFVSLDAVECERLLTRHRVGRLAFTLHDRVEIVPIHYVYEDGWIYGRTSPGAKLLTLLRNRWVAFEIDESEGLYSWKSVIVHGSFYLLERSEGEIDPTYDYAIRLLRRIAPATLTESDPVPFRTQPFRIHVDEMTGRAALPIGGRTSPESRGHVTDPASDAEGDVQLHRDAAAAAARTLGADASRIRITASDGVIVLSGSIHSYDRRRELEEAIFGLPGATAMVPLFDYESPGAVHRTPVELAREAVDALRDADLLDRGIHIVVENGWIRAEGVVNDPDDAREAFRALNNVGSTRGVINRVQTRDQIT